MILEHGLPSLGLLVTAKVYGVKDEPGTYWANANCYLRLPDDLHIKGNGYVGYTDLPTTVIPKILDYYKERVHLQDLWRTGSTELSALAGFTNEHVMWHVQDNRKMLLDYSSPKHNWSGGK